MSIVSASSTYSWEIVTNSFTNSYYRRVENRHEEDANKRQNCANHGLGLGSFIYFCGCTLGYVKHMAYIYIVVDERFEISKDLCCSAGMGWMYKVAVINVHLVLTVQFDILPHVNK